MVTYLIGFTAWARKRMIDRGGILLVGERMLLLLWECELDLFLRGLVVRVEKRFMRLRIILIHYLALFEN